MEGSFATLMGFLWQHVVRVFWKVMVQGMLKRLVCVRFSARLNGGNCLVLLLKLIVFRFLKLSQRTILLSMAIALFLMIVEL